MAYEQEKKFLAEEAAVRVSYWQNPQTGDAILVRRWNTSREDLQSSILAYLSTIKTVTDPQADKKKYPGLWRVVPNAAGPKKGMREAEQGATQTLKKLLIRAASELMSPFLLTDDKALLSPFAIDTTSVKRSYVWEYRWIDPAYAQTIRDTISLTAGVIDAKIVKPEGVRQEEEDGTVNIQVLTQTNTWAGSYSQADDQLNEWETERQSPGFGAERIVRTYSHIPVASLAAARTALGAARAAEGDEYIVSDLKDSVDREEGYVKITQVLDRTFREGVAGSAQTLSPTNGFDTEYEITPVLPNCYVKTTTWIGVKEANITLAMTALQTAPEAPSKLHSGWTVLKLTNGYDATGKAWVRRVMVANLPAGANSYVIQEHHLPGTEVERRTYWFVGLTAYAAVTARNTIIANTNCAAGPMFDVDAALANAYTVVNAELLEGDLNLVRLVVTVIKNWGDKLTTRVIPAEGTQRATTEYTFHRVYGADVGALWDKLVKTDSTYRPGTGYILADKQKVYNREDGAYTVTAVWVFPANTVVLGTAAGGYTAVGYTDDSIIYEKKIQDAENLTGVISTTTTAGQDEVLSGGKNQFDKYDYTARKTVARVPVSGASATWTTYGGYFFIPFGYDTDGSVISVRQYRRSYTHTIGFATTAADAVTAMAVTWPVVLSPGSGISRAGNNLWSYHKIVEGVTLIGTYSM